MDRTSHIGFTVSGAMIANSIVYNIFPQSIQGDWDVVIHAVGTPWHYQDIVGFPQALSHVTLTGVESFIFKLLFYLCLIAWASLPDSLETRTREELDVSLGHRGGTHGLISWIALVSGFGFIFTVAMAYCHLYGVTLNLVLVRAVCVLFIALLAAFFLHSLADMCTRDGVPVLWPIKYRMGLGFRPMRPTNGSLGAYFLLWTFIFVTGALFMAGYVGI